MYSNRKKVLVSNLVDKIAQNKSQQKISWAVWVEEGVNYYYEFSDDEYKSKVWGQSEWTQSGKIENLDWHLVMFFTFNLKGSKSDSIHESVYWYMYKPQHQVNKAVDKLGACVMRVFSKDRN